MRGWWMLLLVGCMRAKEAAPSAAMEERDEMVAQMAPAAAPPEPEMAKMEAKAGRRRMRGLGGVGSAEGGGGLGLAMGAIAKPITLSEINIEGEADGASEPVAATRSWFPETFLFEPRVVTDAEGRGAVTVKVPDRLTTYRVLALAHAREGTQAGAVATFLATLPVYVDLVVPPFLVAGDRVELPVQVVNTSPDAMSGKLSLEVQGPARLQGAGTISVAGESSTTHLATVVAGGPGQLVVKASFGQADAVEQVIPVRSAGMPESQSRAGTLAAPRTLSLDLPKDAELEAARVRLLVFPGALALLRAELGAALSRGGPADDAYALLLAGRAPALATSLGGDTDSEALRKMTIWGTQRAMRHMRTPNPALASIFVEAALAHPESPVLQRLGERLLGQLAASQRPDGTFQGQTGWTLQRLLVATGDGLRALKADAGTDRGRQRYQGARLRAEGAFERSLGRIEDGYTAAAILASGGVSEGLAEKLRVLVKAGIEKRDDGSAQLKVAPGIVRADGSIPSISEATALAILALEGDAKDVVADLGASLLEAYSPGLGWGDGHTNLLALTAVTRLFRDPLPPKVTVTLKREGQIVQQGVLEGGALREVAALEGAISGLVAGQTVTFELVAEPAVPGFAYQLALSYERPWPEAPEAGLQLTVDVSSSARVGQPVSVALSAVAPGGAALEIRHGLPAGVQADRESLSALVLAGTITHFDTSDGLITLQTPIRNQGERFTCNYRVVPTLAGTLHAAPSSVEPLGRSDQRVHLRPAVWTVR